MEYNWLGGIELLPDAISSGCSWRALKMGILAENLDKRQRGVELRGIRVAGLSPFNGVRL